MAGGEQPFAPTSSGNAGPAFAYFDTKTAELKDQLDFYEAATMFHPLLIQRAGGLSEPDLLRLVAFIPRLNKLAMLATLTAQRAEYVTECLATPLSSATWQGCDIEALWHSARFQRLAAWHSAALTVMLAQPSSAPIGLRYNGSRQRQQRRPAEGRRQRR